ncbi:Conserved hypothetical protein [Thermococcus gammatolerans EJ3]|uniref:Uncharacterized protein n=2 Tax=Thermococcus TaxID=2263 RepID=C5A1P5_THEGJ|nr:Conserved hypothetical protein [Thermococcus gammatolerans EJ3]
MKEGREMERVQKATVDLVSLFSGENSEPHLVGILVARSNRRSYNFSLFDITENELVLQLHIGNALVYLAFESPEEIDEDEYPELVEELLRRAVPAVKELIKALDAENLEEPVILYDEMSPDVKEFVYDLLMRHRRGASPYDQTEPA